MREIMQFRRCHASYLKYPRNQGFSFYGNRAGIFRSKLGWPAAKALSYLSAKPNLQCGYGVWPATQKKFLGPYSAFRGELQLSCYLFACSDPTRKWSVYRRCSNFCWFYEEI